MPMPGSNRRKPGAPAAGSKYGKQLHDNAAPFSPAPVQGLESSRSKKGPGTTAIPDTHSGSDETGSGKRQGA